MKVVFDNQNEIVLNEIKVKLDLNSILKESLGEDGVCKLIEIVKWVAKNEYSRGIYSKEERKSIEELKNRLISYKAEISKYYNYTSQAEKLYSVINDKNQYEHFICVDIMIELRLSMIFDLYGILMIAEMELYKVIEYLRSKDYYDTDSRYYDMLFKLKRYLANIFMEKLSLEV